MLAIQASDGELFCAAILADHFTDIEPDNEHLERVVSHFQIQY